MSEEPTVWFKFDANFTGALGKHFQISWTNRGFSICLGVNSQSNHRNVLSKFFWTLEIPSSSTRLKALSRLVGWYFCSQHFFLLQLMIHLYNCFEVSFVSPLNSRPRSTSRTVSFGVTLEGFPYVEDVDRSRKLAGVWQNLTCGRLGLCMQCHKKFSRWWEKVVDLERWALISFSRPTQWVLMKVSYVLLFCDTRLNFHGLLNES